MTQSTQRALWLALAVICAAVFAVAMPEAASAAETPTCGGKEATIVGTDAGEELRGTRFNDVIWAGAGNDRVVGGAGNDIICGSYGHDTLYGATYPDRLLGGPGNDKLYGGDHHDYLHGGPGIDEMHGQGALDKVSWLGSGPVNVNGANGYADTADGRETISGIGWLIGSELNDVMRHRQGKVSGGAGDDTVRADSFAMTVWGNAGDDALSGPSGTSACTRAPSSVFSCFKMFGGTGADTIVGTATNDFIMGETGDDTIDGGAGGDAIGGGDGDDELTGGSGDDRLMGGRGTDTMLGLGGIDSMAPTTSPAYGTSTDVSDGGGDTFDGGDGPDWVDLDGFGYISATVNLTEGTVTAESAEGPAYTATVNEVRSVRGGGADEETIIGNELENVLMGMAGADTIEGRGGDDLLDGGAGVDSATGGGGTDACAAFELSDDCESADSFDLPHAVPWWWNY